MLALASESGFREALRVGVIKCSPLSKRLFQCMGSNLRRCRMKRIISTLNTASVPLTLCSFSFRASTQQPL